MARIPYSIIPLPAGAETRDCLLVRWANMANGDHGQAIQLPAYQDQTVQAVGTPGAGLAIGIEGSMVPVPDDSAGSLDFGSRADPSSTDLVLTAVRKHETIMDLSVWTRPRVTAGDGSTLVTVYLLARRNA